MHTELIRKVRKKAKKQTFVAGYSLTFLGLLVGLFLRFLDVFHQSFTKTVDFGGYEFISGSSECTLS